MRVIASGRAVPQHIEEADVVVPEIWAFEIANGIFVAFSKRKRIHEAERRLWPKESPSSPWTISDRYDSRSSG
jgi:hypothetical protein